MTLQQKIEQLLNKTNLDSDDKKTIADIKNYVEKTENKESKNGYGVLIAGVAIVIILWSANWLFTVHYFPFTPQNDPTVESIEKEKRDFETVMAKRGQFGDMFGSVNALFSGLAFAFLIYTIWLQREELKLQREELKLQREALELQVEELKRQADELEKTSVLQAEILILQKHQLEITERQIEEDKDRIESQNKPIFDPLGVGGSWDLRRANLNLHVKNNGATALNVKVGESPCLNESNKVVSILKHDESVTLNWTIENVQDFPPETNIVLTFTDIFGTEYSQSFKMTKEIDKNYSGSVEFKIVK
jgi:hypothetical protein